MWNCSSGGVSDVLFFEHPAVNIPAAKSHVYIDFIALVFRNLVAEGAMNSHLVTQGKEQLQEKRFTKLHDFISGKLKEIPAERKSK